MKNPTIFVVLLLAAGLSHTAGAAAKAPLLKRSAAMQCADRKIELKGECFKQEGIAGLSCTRQRLSISDAATGRELGSHTFKAAPLQAGEDYPVVAERLGEASCTEAPGGEKFILVMMSNGGNCEQCEWQQLYTWDGKMLGSSLDARKDSAVNAALKGATGKKARVLGQGDLFMYAETTPAADVYAPFGLHCSAKSSQEDGNRIAASLHKRYVKAWGKDWLNAPARTKPIDSTVMEEVVAIAACAAIVDCPNFFNSHIGGELTYFTDIGSKVPLRRQFDEAMAALPPSQGKTALQACMRLEAKK